MQENAFEDVVKMSALFRPLCVIIGRHFDICVQADFILLNESVMMNHRLFRYTCIVLSVAKYMVKYFSI